MRNLRYYLLGVLLLCSPAVFSKNSSSLRDSSDCAKLTYKIGQTSPDLLLKSNKNAFDNLVKDIRSMKAEGDDIAVKVTYFCAPDGLNNINKGIGETRSKILIGDLAARTNLPASTFYTINGEDGWEELYSIISHSDLVEAEEILDIIRDTPSERMTRLKKHNGGRTYSFLKDNVFPMLRARVNVIYGNPEVVDSVVNETKMFAMGVSKLNTHICGDACAYAHQVVLLQAELNQYRQAAKVQKPAPVKVIYQPAPENPGFSYAGDFAIKTNLIYDFITVPSIEVEYRFHTNWSVNVEYDMSWWKNSKKNRSFAITNVSPEIRWWFPATKPMKGYYIGAFPGYAHFDLENRGTGHKGHGVYGGFSLGLSQPISSHVAFEAGLGVGYMGLRYKNYEPVDGTHQCGKSKSTGYFGPLKVKFAIVWHPWASADKNK